MWISLQLFLEVVINGSLISETSAHFNQVLKAKIFVMATVELSLDNTE